MVLIHCLMCILMFPWQLLTQNDLGHFFLYTSSLLKHANHTIHGGETWYACVFLRFHDDHQQKMAYPMTLLHSSNLQTVHGGKTCYMHTHVYFAFHDNHLQKWPQGTFSFNYFFTSQTYYTMHGGGTRHTHVFQGFHDDHQPKMASSTFLYDYFFTSQTLKCITCISAFPLASGTPYL